MAKGSVRLSILSSYDSKGSDQAEKALEKFAVKNGKVVDTENGKQVVLDGTTAALARQSINAGLAADKLDRISTTSGKIGNALTAGVTVPVVAAGAAVIAAASNMESSFANVKKTVDATDEEYKALYDGAINLSTTHPISASAISEIESLGAQLGISKNNLTSFAETVYGLDIATDLDAETAATELAQFANICGTSQDKLGNVASTVVALGNTSATTESNIMNMGMRLAASATQAGMSEANTLALSAALGSLGMEAEAGGTAMSNTINQIDSDVATNGENLSTWASLAGMSVEQFASAWKAGGDSTTQTFAQVVQGMASTKDEGGNLTVLLDELGISGIRQSDAMKRLASSGDLLSKSISTANTAYSENTALGNEVANFEDTFASKLEITKNKITAVAIETGGPLLDALGSALDASEPLITMVQDAADAFVSMDEGQQQTVLGLIALAAAAGPVFKIIQAGTGIASSALKGYEKITGSLAKMTAEYSVGGVAADTAAKSTTGLAKTTELATTSTDKFSASQTASAAKTKLAAGAANLAKGAISILSGIVLGQAVAAYQQWKKEQDDLKKATEGLTSAQYAALGSLQVTDSAIESSCTSYIDLHSNVSKVVEAQSRLASSVQSTFSESNANIGMLQSYQDSINELANKSGLTATEQARLQVAVDGLNSACGTSYTLIDAENGVLADSDGAILNNVDSINSLISAKQRQLQADALSQVYADAYKQQAEDARVLADAEKTLAQAKENFAQAQELQASGVYLGEGALNSYIVAVNAAQGDVDRAKGTYDAATASVASFSDQQTLMAMATQQGSDSLASAVSSNISFTATMAAGGKKVTDFTTQLSEAGVSVADFSSLNDEQLSTIASSYDGTFGSIAGILSQYGIDCHDAGVNGPNSMAEGIAESQPNLDAASATSAQSAVNAAVANSDGSPAGNTLTQTMQSGIGSVNGQAAAMAQGAVGASIANSNASGAGSNLNTTMRSAINPNASNAAAASTSINAVNAARSNSDASGVGGNLSSTFFSSIDVNAGIRAAADMAHNAIDAAKRALGIASPSRVFREIGEYSGEGFGLGFEDSTDQAVAKATDMSNKAVEAAYTAYEKVPQYPSISVGSPARAAWASSSEVGSAQMIVDAIGALQARIATLEGRLGQIIYENAPVVTESEKDFNRRVLKALGGVNA